MRIFFVLLFQVMIYFNGAGAIEKYGRLLGDRQDSYQKIESVDAIFGRKIDMRSSRDMEVSYGVESTKKWQYENTEQKIQWDVTVGDDVATFNGEIDGEAIQKQIQLTGPLVTHPPHLYFDTELLTKKGHAISRMVIDKRKGKLLEMVFTNVGAETIDYFGVERKTIKIEMKPPGIKGMFWKAHYWFDAESLTYLQYRGLDGPPGSLELFIWTF